MKVKVIERFRDKYTGKMHEVDDVMTVSKDRYEEILTKGALVEKVAEPKKTKKDE